MSFLGDGVLSLEEIRNFYAFLAGVKEEEVDKVAEEGYRVLTAVSSDRSDHKY